MNEPQEQQKPVFQVGELVWFDHRLCQVTHIYPGESPDYPTLYVLSPVNGLFAREWELTRSEEQSSE